MQNATFKPCHSCHFYANSGKTAPICTNPALSKNPEPIFYAALKCGPGHPHFRPVQTSK